MRLSRKDLHIPGQSVRLSRKDLPLPPSSTSDMGMALMLIPRA